MARKLNEFLAVPRGELEPVSMFYGTPIFTSQKLKDKYLLAMQKTGKTSPIANTIEKLINNKTLTPVYSTDKILKSLMKKQPLKIKGVAGLLSDDKKIYIFVETETNIFSFTSNDALATVTIHELIHYFSSLYLRDFYNIFKSDLERFYGFYFTRFFSCDLSKITKTDITTITKFINFKLERSDLNFSNQMLKQYYNLLTEIFKPSSTLENFDAKVTSLIVLMKLLQKLIHSGATHAIENTIDKFEYIITPLYVSYKQVFGVNPMIAKNLCFQELWSTSEVIAIPAMVKTPNKNIYKALAKL